MLIQSPIKKIKDFITTRKQLASLSIELEKSKYKNKFYFDEMKSLLDDKITLEDELKKIKKKFSPILVDYNLGDPSPKDKLQRKAYTASVSQIYQDILEPKLKQMISTTHKILAEPENERDSDIALKGTIYAFQELMTWAERMHAESMSYTLDETSSRKEVKSD